MIDTSIFPYQSFGVRLEHKDEKKICWFVDDYELQRYITRHNLKVKELSIQYRDEKSTKFSKTNTKSLQQTIEKDDCRSGSGYRRSTKDLDTSRSINSTRKSKK